jgi:hypothetical protein
VTRSRQRKKNPALERAKRNYLNAATAMIRARLALSKLESMRLGPNPRRQSEHQRDRAIRRRRLDLASHKRRLAWCQLIAAVNGPEQQT